VADIFLSYNREDQPKAKVIAKALEAEGFDVWWDTVLRAGQTYDEVTERQLHEAKAVVVLWSTRSVRSKWVRAEATLGDRKSALIPVMLEPCDRPIMFELIQTADLVGWEGDTLAPAWRALVADVRDHVDRKDKPKEVAAATPAVDAAPAPVRQDQDSIEAAFWMSIEDGDDPEEFEAYLERYPAGHFATLARKRLASLASAKAQSVAPVPELQPATPPPPPTPPLRETPRVAAGEARPLHAAQAPPQRDAFKSVDRSVSAGAGKKSTGSPLLFILIGVIGVAAVAGFLLLPKGGTEDAPAEIASAPSPAEEPPPPPEPVAVQTVSNPESPEAPDVAAETPPPPVVEATFRDCAECPEMTRISAGAFLMGSAASEAGHRAWEGPQREVTMPAFAMGSREVSFAEWDACVQAGGCNNYSPTDRGWGRGQRPVMMVSWNDAKAYARWLSSKTGKTYRLPTESEWEYSARGGATTAYWWGDTYDRSRLPSGKTSETGSHEPNAFGLYDVAGNVGEWVEDCYANSFSSAPTDGSAVTQSGCSQRVLRGGDWNDGSDGVRLANRSRLAPGTRDASIGFRVAVTE
jgi:formylglycine-generating enzyme required for sulfatase activity